MTTLENHRKRWTAEDNELLMSYYSTMSHKKLADQLGRTVGAIEMQYSMLKCGRATPINGVQPVEPAPPNEPLPAPTMGYDDIVLAAWRAGHEIIIPAMGITLRKPTA